MKETKKRKKNIKRDRKDRTFIPIEEILCLSIPCTPLPLCATHSYKKIENTVMQTDQYTNHWR